MKEDDIWLSYKAKEAALVQELQRLIQRQQRSESSKIPYVTNGSSSYVRLVTPSFPIPEMASSNSTLKVRK
jgi:hypothetical protein